MKDPVPGIGGDELIPDSVDVVVPDDAVDYVAVGSIRVVDDAVRRVLVLETILVLGVSLGRSAISSFLSILNKLTLEIPLNEQTTNMNPSYTPDRPWLDFLYQVANFVLPLVPVALALFLLTQLHPPAKSATTLIGFDFKRFGRDSAQGFLIAAAIGIPGLGFYLLSRTLGINTNVSPANLTENWWTVPVYIAFALMNGVLEEVLMLGYLFTRWWQSGWSTLRIIIVSALIRGSYHLYQGFGGFIGNFVMGLFFGYLYTKTKRVMPLVIAHTLLDIVAFVGYALMKDLITWL